MSSMTEIMMFLVFFCLILLGTLVNTNGAQKEDIEAYQTTLELEERRLSGLIAERNELLGALQDARLLSEQASQDIENAVAALNGERTKSGGLAISVEDLQTLLNAELLNTGALRRELGILQRQLDAEKQRSGGLEQTVGDLRKQLDDEHERTGGLETSVGQLQSKIDEENTRTRALSSQVENLLAELNDAEIKIIKLNQGLDDVIGKHDRPLFMELEADANYTFEPNVSNLSPNFRRAFIYGSAGKASGISELLNLLQGSPIDIVAIEVIGHTDEVPLRQGNDGTNYYTSDLDREMLRVFNSRDGDLQAADNAGLGLARAVQTSILIRDQLRNSPFSGVAILPMSAGHLHTRENTVSRSRDPNWTKVGARRRIEIRIRSN